MFEVTNLYVLIAREVSTDPGDNMTSISKIIDKFNFGLDREQLAKDGVRLGKQVLGLPSEYAVATSWLIEPKLKKETFFIFKVTVIDPAGQNLPGPEQENLLPAGMDKVNMNFNIQGINVTSAGKYILRAEMLSKNNKLLAFGEYPFEVEFN